MAASLNLVLSKAQSRLYAFKDVFFYIGISILINLINFGYNLYLSNKLIISEFGVVIVLTNIIALAQIPTNSFTKSLTHKVSNEWGLHKIFPSSLWNHYRQKSYKISLILALIWLVSIPLLMYFFKITVLFPFLVMMPLWVLLATTSVDAGYLLGIHKFKEVSLVMLVEAVTIFLITLIFVEINLATYLYAAIPIASVITFFLYWYLARKNVQSIIPAQIIKTPSFPWKFYLTSLISKFSVIAFISVDILLAKHYLDADDAGRYAILSTIGKILFYATSLLGQFIVPLVSKKLGEGQNTRELMILILVGTLVLLLPGYLVLGIFGAWTVPYLMGNESLSIVDLLPYYLFGMICFGLSSLIITYDQSKKRYISSAISGLSIVAVIGGIMLFHSSIYEISTVMTFVGILCLALNVMGLGVRATKSKFHKKQSKVTFTKILKYLRISYKLDAKI